LVKHNLAAVIIESDIDVDELLQTLAQLPSTFQLDQE